MAQLALEVEQVLLNHGCAPFVYIAQHVRSADDSPLREERIFEGQLAIGAGVVAPAAAEVALHIEPRVARVLGVEDARTRSDRPLATRTPGDAQPRREVGVVGGDQAIAQAAIARHLNAVLEPHRLARIEVTRANPDENRVPAQVGHVRSRVDERHIRIHFALALVVPRRHELVAQAEVDGQVWAQLESVVEVV